jgi:hypothetical protein
VIRRTRRLRLAGLVASCSRLLRTATRMRARRRTEMGSRELVRWACAITGALGLALVIVGRGTTGPSASLVSPGAMLDQSNPSRAPACRYTGWVPDDATGWAAQTFTAGVTGSLTNVVLWLRVSDPRISVAITPVDASGQPVVATKLASTGLEVATIGTYVDVEVSFSTRARVEAGTRYAIVLFAPTTAVPSSWTWKADVGSSTVDPSGVSCADGTYAGGRLWVSSAPFGADADFFFQTYVVPVRHVDVQKTGTGTGLVQDSSHVIDCGSTCSGESVQGATLTLTAIPDSGSTFSGWSGSGCTGSGSTCSVAVTGDVSVAAEFTRKPVTLTIHRSGRGAVKSLPPGITCGPRCSHGFVPGPVKLTATPSSGWKFVRWEGACRGTRTVCRLMLQRPRAVGAIFARRHR